MKEENGGKPLVLSFRPSFREAISRAERQIAAWAICADTPTDKPLVREICAIIAEVYMMHPERPIRISGEWLDGYVVQEVFGQLGQMHALAVIEQFRAVTDEIRNKKAYLRTSLYNSAFSLNAHYTNKVNHDLRGD